MKLESDKVIVNSSISEIIDFLKNAQNLYELLPKDNISDFKADETQCSFKVQGGFEISLVENGVSNNILHLKSGEKTPFPFTLAVTLNAIDDQQTEGFIAFDGEVNMFLKMMVEKPLSNLFNYMSRKLKEKYQ
jgi:hypothetical protein